MTRKIRIIREGYSSWSDWLTDNEIKQLRYFDDIICVQIKENLNKKEALEYIKGLLK